MQERVITFLGSRWPTVADGLISRQSARQKNLRLAIILTF